MAGDIEQLVVQLEARVRDYERNMERAQKQTNRAFRDMRDGSRRASSQMQRDMATASSRVTRSMEQTQRGAAALSRTLIGVFGTGMILRQAQSLTDAHVRVQNALKVTGLEGEKLTRVYDQLFAAAQDNAAPLEALTTLYGRAAQVQNELGVSTQELIGFTENVATALRVSGQSAQESSGALMQLGQALGSGIVRAEEFNSLLEGALPVAQAAAAGLEEAGGSVSRLRQLVIDGKVSSEAFFRAFEAGSVILEEKVANAELTTSQRFVRLQNVLIDTAGQFNQVADASGAMGGVIDEITGYVTAFSNALANANNGPIPGFVSGLGDVIGAMQDAADRAREGIGLEQFFEDTSLIEGKVGSFFDGQAQSIAGARQQLDAYVSSLQGMPNMGASDVDVVSQEQIAQVQVLINALLAGEAQAGATRAQLQAIEQAHPELGHIIGEIDTLIGSMKAAQNQALATSEQILLMRRASYASMEGLDNVSPDIPASHVSLGDYELPSIPAGGGGGGGRSSAISAAQREANAVQEVIDKLKFERAQLARTNSEQELYTYLKRAGVERNSEFGQSIETAFLALQKDQAARDYFDDIEERAEDMAKTVSGTIGETFSSIFEGPIKSWDNLVDKVMSGLGQIADYNFSLLSESFTSGFGAQPQNAAPETRIDPMAQSVTEGLDNFFGQFTGTAQGSGMAMLGAGLGGLSVGYSTQSPLMGAVGGAMQGFAAGAALGGAGGPIGAVLGSAGGKIGNPFTRPANDNPAHEEKREAA